MPRCPRDRTMMKPLGISWVCPRCDFKMIRRDKSWTDSLRWFVYFPREFDWDSFTNTNVSVSNGVASISTGETEATMISPQITNLNSVAKRYKDIRTAKIEEVTATKLNNGKIYFHVSNDGGTTFTPIKDNGHRWDLNYGNEVAGKGTKQVKYNDLRLKITLWRETSSDTSSTISYLKLSHTYIPDRKPRRVRSGNFARPKG